MLNFRQLLFSTFIFATCYCITYGQNDIATNGRNSVKSTIPTEMKITSWNDMPFSGLVMENGTWVGKGYAFYLLKLLSSKLNFTYTIIPPEQHVLGNSNESGILNLLYERFVLAAVISVGPVIYTFATFRAKLWNKPDSENFSLFSCVWFVYSSLLKQGTNIIATTDSTRILIAMWWIFILILTSFYTANLTAFLTRPQFTLPINNVQDILRKGYQWVTYKGRTIDLVLSEFHDVEDLNLLNVTRWKDNYITSYEYPVNDIFNALEKNKLFLGETHYLKTLIFENYINKTRQHLNHRDRCTYVIMPNTIYLINKAFAFPINSTLKKLFNKELITLMASGIMTREKLRKLPIAQVCPLDLRSTERQLSIADLSLTFKVILAGYMIAMIIFVLEILINWLVKFYKRRKKIGKKSDRTFFCKWKRKSNDSLIPQLVYTTKNQLFDKRNIQLPFSNIPYDIVQGKKYCINGRDYYIVFDRYGDQRLIPIRTPSAFLFQYTA
ncbi:PREDICTED: glutamate receptor 1 [Atta cephalotes]|uniref:Ionotropic glutamate receptor C-terminal domain-containing protein n=1 Tax=Atta cephalotes TaxID=12957 RepID=A0A158NY66_ATTCE|nr:PREDICTED: glutamate receptor 1 [Atta cephalotes]